jgi:hypothetical protein
MPTAATYGADDRRYRDDGLVRQHGRGQIMASENKNEMKQEEKKHGFDANQKDGDKRKQEEAKTKDQQGKKNADHSAESKDRKDMSTKH